MSEQDSKIPTGNTNKMIVIIGIILGVGSVAMYLTMSLPDTNEIDKIECFGDDDCRGHCGKGTFYHEATNSCETYPEIKQEMKIDEVNDEIEKPVSDIRFDVDGNRIVIRDSKGIPMVDCTPYENKQYSINRDCKIVFK